MPKRFKALFLSLAFTFAGGAHAQIPTTDLASLIQQVQQVASWAQQLKAMADQVEQYKQQLNALTGTRNLGQLLRNPLLQEYFQGNETPSVQMLKQLYGGNPCAVLTDPAAAQACQNVSAQPYNDYEQIGRALSVANQKPQQIQSLIDEIDQTDDPKAIAELQARIAGEQAAMQNENIKMQLTLQQMQIQTQLVKEQQSRVVSERERALKEKARSMGYD